MSLSSVPPALLVRCQKGDLDSFESLFGMIREDLYRLIYSFMRDHDDTDEVMQESLIRMFRHMRGLKDVEKFASWAMRIVVNQCHTHRTRKGRHTCASLDEMIEREDHQAIFRHGLEASPREALMQNEVVQKIQQAIGELPKRQRAAILLFEIEGCSIKEVAETMQCSEGAVKFNVHQARKKLQEALRAEWTAVRRTLSGDRKTQAGTGEQG